MGNGMATAGLWMSWEQRMMLPGELHGVLILVVPSFSMLYPVLPDWHQLMCGLPCDTPPLPTDISNCAKPTARMQGHFPGTCLQ